MRPATALYQLSIMPEAFLRNNLLLMSGSAVSGQRAMYIGKSFAQPRGVGAPNEAFKIAPNGGGIAEAHQFAAYNVRMVPDTEDMDTTAIEVLQLGNAADFMVTGQLSACAFAVLRTGGNTYVAHIQPQPNGARGSGALLRTTLQNTGRFAGHAATPLTAVFGLGDYHIRAHVIGVRRNGIWEIYGQHVTGGGGSAATITAVTRII